MRAAIALAVLGLAWPAQAAGEFSADAAWRQLERQVAFGPRVPGTESHRKALDYLADELRRSGAKVELESFMVKDASRTVLMTNVVATFAAGRGDAALVGAHWDSRPRSEQDPHPAHRSLATPGANDGASGVAVLLEVARVLGQNPPPREVRLVLFDGEDWGDRLDAMFYGSRAYVARHSRKLPAWGLLLDMVGDRDLRIPQEALSLRLAGPLARRVYDLAAGLGYATHFPAEKGPEVYDDHLAFLQAGVPMVDLIDFDYAEWHTVHDLPAACAPDSLRVVGEVVLAALRAPIKRN